MDWNRKNLGDIGGSLLFIAIAIAVIIGSIQLQVGTPTNPQPGFFPLLGGVVVTALASILLVQGWLGRGRRAQALGEVRRPAVLVAGIAVYVAILDPVGYLLATLLLSAAFLRVLGVRSWRALGLASCVLSVGSYLIFARLLGVELPPGILNAFL